MMGESRVRAQHAAPLPHVGFEGGEGAIIMSDGAIIMGIFTDNPVLQREMRSRLRLRRVLGSRPMAWVAGVTTVVIVYFYVKGLIAIGRGETNDARDLWSYLVLFLLLLIVVIAPALLSTAITQEREQQTWDSLTRTNLTAGEVLLGKWLARLSLTALPIVVLLPFLIGCSVKGDIGALTDMAVLLFLALTAGTYGVLGLLCSFFARKTVTATVVSLTVTIFLCVGTSIVDALLSSFLRAASTDYSYQDSGVLWMSPFYRPVRPGRLPGAAGDRHDRPSSTASPARR